MTTRLVTFSDLAMERSAELCVRSAKRHGFNEADSYSRSDIESSGWASDEPLKVLALMDSNSRGAGGSWCWKPFIILEAMMMCGKDEILAYSDAGVEFINNVNFIIDRMDQDIWLFGNQYEHAHWCKRDIIEAIWPLTLEHLQMAEEHGGIEARDSLWREMGWSPRFGKQVQASVIFFRVNDKTRAFVKEWLDWCLFEGGRLIDDSPSRTPNHPEFQENRHDQAILTTMAYRDNIPFHYWPASYNNGAFEYPRGGYPDEEYPILFSHHRGVKMGEREG